MEFGRVPENELGKIDFTLPGEPAFNKKVLKGKPAKNLEQLYDRRPDSIFVGGAFFGAFPALQPQYHQGF